MLILFIHYSFFCKLSQIHEIDVGKNCYDYQAYNRTYHAAHHLLDDEHADDDDDKTCYMSINYVPGIKTLYCGECKYIKGAPSAWSLTIPQA